MRLSGWKTISNLENDFTNKLKFKWIFLRHWDIVFFGKQSLLLIQLTNFKD